MQRAVTEAETYSVPTTRRASTRQGLKSNARLAVSAGYAYTERALRPSSHACDSTAQEPRNLSGEAARLYAGKPTPPKACQFRPAVSSPGQEKNRAGPSRLHRQRRTVRQDAMATEGGSDLRQELAETLGIKAS